MITPTQRRVAEFIQSYIDANGYSPSVREITAGMGNTSTNGTLEVLARLERDGVLTRPRGVARSVRLTDEGKELVGGCDE